MPDMLLGALWAFIPIFILVGIGIAISEARNASATSEEDKRTAAWKEVWDSLTEEQRAAYYVAVHLERDEVLRHAPLEDYEECLRLLDAMNYNEHDSASEADGVGRILGVQPFNPKDSDFFERKATERLGLVMNPDWFASNRELILGAMEARQRRNQQTALAEMTKKLR